MSTLDKTLADLNKKYGTGSVQRLGDSFLDYDIETSPSGSFTLDLALGGKGIPLGRIIEFFGPEMSGKTTLALLAMAQMQKTGSNVAFIDAEHALDPNLCKAYGLNIKDLIINQPSTAEEAMDVVEHLVKSDEVRIITVDSVSSLVPSAEAEADIEKETIGLQARFMSKALRRLVPLCSEHNCTVIFINQLREKIGVMYGNPETTSGGRALKFYSSIRVDIRPNGGVSGQIKDSAGNIIGNTVKCRVVKNKIFRPYGEAIFKLIFGQGIDVANEVLTVALTLGVVKQGGAWFSFGEEGAEHHFKLQGRESVEAHLREHPEVLDYFKSIIAV